jgi:DNA replication and repair protein RecF
VILSLENFRNIASEQCELSPEVTVFLGDNGQGKTSVLEALYLLSLGKSFRSSVLFDTIFWGKECASVFLSSPSFSGGMRFASAPKKQVKYFLDEKEVSYFSFLGNFLSVLFSPQDMNILQEGVTDRRNYLDALLIRLDKEYASLLRRYEKAVKQRNALLKSLQENPSLEAELSSWDALVYELARPLVILRKSLIQELLPFVQKFAKKISPEMSEVFLEYTEKHPLDSFQEGLLERRKKDIILGVTTIGPHRDSFEYFLRGKNAQQFSSQGEKRTLILALKLAEIELLEQKKGQKSLLLLDDVFSELDLKRQSALLEVFSNHQVCVSVTHIDESIFLKNAKVIEVEKGRLK